MKTVPITCHKCGKEILKPKPEYNRQIRKGRTKFYCSISCSTKDNLTIHHKIIANCLWCKKEFETTTHKRFKKCCSNDCAHKYARSFVDVKQTSLSMKKAWERGDFNNSKGRILKPRIYNFTCVICKQSFQRITKKLITPVKTCSDVCFRELLRRKARDNPNCGGDTNYKKYKYNNVWMDSKWEVEIAKWMDDRNIKWERSRKLHQFLWTDKNGNKRRYYPDFYLPCYNVYLDPKNKYLIKVDNYKIHQVIKENGIVLHWGLLEDIKRELDILRKV